VNFFDSMAALKKAHEAIDRSQEIRAERVTSALLSFAADARAVTTADLADVVKAHLPLVLKASSQGSAVRELARSMGLADYVKDLVNKLDGKD
jgi:hypothetical protein